MSLRGAIAISVVCVVSASSFAQRPDPPRINERYPIQSPSNLSPPIVRSPIHDCARVVYVSGFVPHATVTVLAGASVVATRTPDFGFADIKLSREVHTGEVITATQTVNGITSGTSAPVTVTAMPPLTKPTIASTVYDCGLIVPAGNLVESSHVRVTDAANSSLLGEADNDGTWWPVVTSALVAGRTVTAEQQGCSGTPPGPRADAATVQPDPSPMPVPVVDPPIAGNDAVTMHNLLTGASLTVLDHATTIGGGLATGSDNWTHVPPLAATASVSVVQRLCTPSDPSTPQTPGTSLHAPTIIPPICTNAKTVTIRNTVINANVVLFVNGTIAGYGGATPGDLVLAFATGTTLHKGDAITARQTIGSIISPSSVPIYVACDAADVVTQHNDSSRTGAYLREASLTPASVAGPNFGMLYRRNVDGDVLAQTLYVRGVQNTAAGTKNLFFVATAKNWIYAFDADNLNTDPATPPVWSRQIELVRHYGPDELCGETQNGFVGVTATPVIDVDRQIMYVVARRSTTRGAEDDGQTYIHALRLSDGSDFLPAVRVQGRYHDTVFNSLCHRNRPGLLLQNGRLYLGFGTFQCDQGCPGDLPYHGWIFGYDALDFRAHPKVFATSEGGGPREFRGDGVWQSGNGLVGDAAGNVYFETGNGVDPYGDSFLRLTPGLDAVLARQVNNGVALNAGDTDLGSAGPILLQSDAGPRLLGGGKEGRFYVIDPATMTYTQNSGASMPDGIDGFQAFHNSWHNDASKPQCLYHDGPTIFRYNAAASPGMACTRTNVAAPPAGYSDVDCYIPPPTYQCTEHEGPNIHAGPVYWNGRIYHMPEKDYLRAFPFDTATGHVTETGTAATDATVLGHPIMSRPVDGMPGGATSVSAFKNRNGIIWTNLPLVDGQWNNGPGRIIAFDATTLVPIWYDDGDVFYAKFNPPTVANGKVFRNTFSNMVVVYGLRPSRRLGGGFPSKFPSQELQELSLRCVSSATKREELGRILGDEVKVAQQPRTAVRRDFVARIVEGINAAPVAASVHVPHASCTHPELARPTEVATSVFEGIGPRAGCAHMVRGDIRALYLKLNGPDGKLGLPISDERLTDDSMGRHSYFEHGEIVWYPDKGAHVVMAKEEATSRKP